MSINHDHLHRLVTEMEQGVAATTRYSWLDLAQEVLRMRKELISLREEARSAAKIHATGPTAQRGLFLCPKEKHMKKPRHYRHNLCMPRPARELIKKYRQEKAPTRSRPTILYR